MVSVRHSKNPILYWSAIKMEFSGSTGVEFSDFSISTGSLGSFVLRGGGG